MSEDGLMQTPEQRSRATVAAARQPETETPKPEEITDDLASGSASRNRLSQQVDTVIPEPDMEILGHVSPDQALRDQTKFAIISRHLFLNEPNAAILLALQEAGFGMSLRNLQRLLARSDFQQYYEQFRQNALGPLDKVIRESMRQAMPEAFNHLVTLMRKSRDSTRLEAIRLVLEGGGAIRKESVQKKFTVNVTDEMVSKLLEVGQRALEPTPPPAVLRPEDVIDGEIVEDDHSPKA